MRYILISFCLIVAGCGSDAPSGSGDAGASSNGACANSVNGAWHQGIETLTLNSDCTGSINLCNSKFTYTLPSGGYATVTVSETSAVAGCLTVGSHTCEIDHTEPDLYLRCVIGAPWTHYNR